jgi:hypothetical protein
MAAHKGPVSLRPRCIRGGSSVAAIPVYHLRAAKFSYPGTGVWYWISQLHLKQEINIKRGGINIFQKI